MSIPRRTVAAAALALLGLASAPAHALVTIYPGSNCRSEGPVEHRLNGEIWNKATGLDANAWTLFVCPVILTQYNLYGTDVRVTLYARLNGNVNASFLCALRSTRTNGELHDTTEGVLPPSTPNNGGLYSALIAVGMPAQGVQASVNLRCRLPNGSTSAGWAGIVSYKVEHS